MAGQKMTEAFLQVPPHLWEAVAAHLPEVWPVEAAIIDLKHWNNRVIRWDAGNREAGVARIPGHKSLSERWGWGAKKTRLLMSSDKWHTRGKPVMRKKQKGTPRAPQGHPKGTPRALKGRYARCRTRKNQQERINKKE